MQAASKYTKHPLSKQFIDQFNQDKRNLKVAYLNALQEIQTLTQSYKEAFDPFFRAAWYEDLRSLKSIKKKIAVSVVAAAENYENLSKDQYHFLFDIAKLQQKIATAIDDNKACDTNPIDFFIKKSSRLDAELQGYKKSLEAISEKKNHFVNQYLTICKNRLNYLYTALAIVQEEIIALEQTDHGVISNNDLPFQHKHEYHFKPYLEQQLNNNIDDPKLIDFVNKEILQSLFVLINGEYQRVLAIGSEEMEQLKNLSSQLLNMIHDVKLIFFEIFMLNCMEDKTIQMTKNNNIEYFLKLFLITDFTYQLPFKEKEYWWRLIVQDHHVGGGRHIKEMIVGKRFQFYMRDDFWDFLIACYISHPTIYASSPTIDFLKNSLLAIWCTNEKMLHSADLEKEFKNAIEDNDIPLNKILSKKTDNRWKLFHGDHSHIGYRKCDWHKEILAMFSEEVLDPLKQVNHAILNSIRIDESSYIGQLFLRANAYIDAMTKDDEALQFVNGKIP